MVSTTKSFEKSRNVRYKLYKDLLYKWQQIKGEGVRTATFPIPIGKGVKSGLTVSTRNVLGVEDVRATSDVSRKALNVYIV